MKDYYLLFYRQHRNTGKSNIIVHIKESNNFILNQLINLILIYEKLN